MIIDLINIILNRCRIREAIRITQINKYTYNNTYIFTSNATKNMYTQEILEKRIFSKLRTLDCSNNINIVNVKGKNLFSLQPSTIVMVSCQSFIANIERLGM